MLYIIETSPCRTPEVGLPWSVCIELRMTSRSTCTSHGGRRTSYWTPSLADVNGRARSCRIQATGLLVWLLLLGLMCREHLTVCHELILCLNRATDSACRMRALTRLGCGADAVWLFFILERNKVYWLIRWGPAAVFFIYWLIYYLFILFFFAHSI